MERNRRYNRDHPHRESPESRKKSDRKYRISSYGLTQECYRLRYLNTQRLNYLWMIRHVSARIAGNLIT